MFAASVLAFILVAAVATAARPPHVRRTGGMPAPRAHATVQGSPTRNARVQEQTRPTLYRGLSASEWAARYRSMWRRYTNAKRTLLTRPSVAEAIDLAATAYRIDAGTLWRKARCESHLDPNARNGSEASGLFQFLPSTFASTPFGRFSIWSPYANALAAGWMHSVGRGGEWVCR